MLDHKNKELNEAVFGTGNLCLVRCQVYPPVSGRAIPNRRYPVKLSKPCLVHKQGTKNIGTCQLWLTLNFLLVTGQIEWRQVRVGTEMASINSRCERLQWEEGGCSSCRPFLFRRFVVESVPHRPAVHHSASGHLDVVTLGQSGMSETPA